MIGGWTPKAYMGAYQENPYFLNRDSNHVLTISFGSLL